MHSEYYFDEKQRFVIENYDCKQTLSSFLPGIAGVKGIPMWTFYVNRGQGVCSFGIRDKNSPIMEFSPAHIAYQQVTMKGFRTFIKRKDQAFVYEPFQPVQDREQLQRRMIISANELIVEEVNQAVGIKTEVRYVHLAETEVAGLVRELKVTNISDQEQSIELLDGVPEILPAGIENQAYKEVGNLLRSWMDVHYPAENLPVYRVRASIGDEAEVKEIKNGHFYFSFADDHQLLSPIVDSSLIFGEDTSLQHPIRFSKESLSTLLDQKQITVNKVPCGFTPFSKTLLAEESFTLYTVIGHTNNEQRLTALLPSYSTSAFIQEKQTIATKLVEQLTKDVETKTSSDRFDSYCKQSYLDNLLRGGYPNVLENHKEGFIYHIYSRKHGDLERDYNFFTIAPEFYSQGNGNYRDMNQNRRNDVFFEPKAGLFNVRMFMSLVQMDGYNPLLVKGSTFKINVKQETELRSILAKHVPDNYQEMLALLQHSFTPGQVLAFLSDHTLLDHVDSDALLTDILSFSEQQIEASHGEGYWIDHWTYNFDLIENYLSVFPDFEKEFLLLDNSYRYFDSPIRIHPRKYKYVETDRGVRQYHGITVDHEKQEKLSMNVETTNWLRVAGESGEIYQTNLFVKLLTLVLTKFSSLDPAGIGMEMEAGKPGWNDAMNGLPGLMGSSVGEVAELKRIVHYLLEKVTQYSDVEVYLPIELLEFYQAINDCLEQYNQNQLTDFDYWDQVSLAREHYRDKIRFGITGAERALTLETLKRALTFYNDKLMQAIEKAEVLGDGIVPTYFIYEVEDYQYYLNDHGEQVKDDNGLPFVNVKAFSDPIKLPYFLEGPTRVLKINKDKRKAQEQYQKVKASDLYDRKLKMYKTSEDLSDQSFEIGRIKAFTPGWLERESIFLHMSYKYLLELLRGDMVEAFYEEVTHGMIPFLDPSSYGRSTLENVSFIASSVNPDPTIHGKGFVARLSGSTAEFLSMWKTMMMGNELFKMENDELRLYFSPKLPKWLFHHDKVSFTFLGCTKVTYENPMHKDTFGEEAVKVQRYTIVYHTGETYTIQNHYIPERHAKGIRNQQAKSIHIQLG